MYTKIKRQTTRILVALLAFTATFMSCDKEKPDVAAQQERDIYYVVSKSPSLALVGGNSLSTHLSTEAEWDALLDRFCEYAKSGEQVMFCSDNNSQSQSQAKGTPSNTPTTITTSDSQELKAWMKAMEQAGKTVRVTYDDNSGTWNGTAYANLSHEETLEAQVYTGTLVFVPTPVLDTPPTGGEVWAIQLADGSTPIITMHGMMILNSNLDTDYNIEGLQGAMMTLEGVISTYEDLMGNEFKTIDLAPLNGDVK